MTLPLPVWRAERMPASMPKASSIPPPPGLAPCPTTISIASLKVFDIVRTMTAGANNTSVIANEMYTQFRSFEAGRSAAFAVILFLLVMPIVIYNAIQLKKQREVR